MNWIEKLFSWFKPGSPVQTSGEQSAPSEAEGRMVRLMTALAETQDVELGCEDVYRLLDQYAEAIQNGEDPEKLMPLVKQHLEICQECDEELQAVLEILRSLPPSLDI